MVIAAAACATSEMTETSSVIRTARELSAAVYDRAEAGRTFSLDASLSFQLKISDTDRRFYVRDDSGAVLVDTKNASPNRWPTRVGDRLAISGIIDIGPNTHLAYARCTNIAVLAHGPIPMPLEVTCADLIGGAFDYQLVTFTASVRDVVADQIDAKFVYLILGGESSSIPCSLYRSEYNHVFGENSPVGCKVEVTGLCIAAPLTHRRQFGRRIAPLPGEGIKIVAPPPADPFDAPEIGMFRRLQPAQIAALERHRVTGRVLAVAKRRTAILRTETGNIHNVQLSSDTSPTSGASITAVGFPNTDLYRINLVRAIWRSVPGPNNPLEVGSPARPRDILYDESGNRRYDATYHGRAIRMEGIVRGLRFVGDETSLKLECDGHLVDVDASACPSAIDGLEVGCGVAISGVCSINTEPWSPDTVFPGIVGYSLVMRTPHDLVVTARPPWWTPGRLFAAIGLLFAALFAILAWNIMLRRVSERRGKELAAEQVAHVESEMKVYERTRLAVELHDALSQNLAGISFEIDAAERLSLSDGRGAQRHLAVASRSLDSCRAELKNCIWDLRSNALGDADMDTAIRRTLAPHVDDGVLSVRFNVPRESFSDATAHAVLCIIRELVVNAVRHGGATRVRVAGSIEGGKLVFSVKDNGCGFDPENAPGSREGHYGLLGIRERVESFNGEFSIESSLGKGTRATVSIWTKSES